MAVRRLKIPRPPKNFNVVLDRELIQVYCNYLKDGALMADVSGMLGIAWSTVKDWQKEGYRLGEEVARGLLSEEYLTPMQSLKISFYYQTLDAQSQCKSKCATRIVGASNDDWKAAAWYLERRDPKNWGKKEELKATVTNKKLNIDFKPMTEEEMKKDKDIEC